MKKLLVLVAAMVMIAGYANAAEWNFYGSARVSTFWTTTDANTVGVADVDAFAMALQGNSRIGANVKVSDELTGRFEAGNAAAGWGTRIIWGEWNFGSGSFGVGQHYTPIAFFYSNQVFGGDSDLIGFGEAYSGRNAQLRLKFGSFDLAFLPVGLGAHTALAAGEVTEVMMPAVEASYSLKMGAIAAKVAGGYQSYEITSAAAKWDIDSYVLSVGAKGDIGPAYVRGNVYMGQNPAGLITSVVAGAATRTGISVNDRDHVGYTIVIGGKVNDMLGIEFGYGHVASELDNTIGGVGDDDITSYYGQAVITLAPGVYVIPEIGVVDNEEVGTNEVMYYGAKWQINF